MINTVYLIMSEKNAGYNPEKPANTHKTHALYHTQEKSFRVRLM